MNIDLHKNYIFCVKYNLYNDSGERLLIFIFELHSQTNMTNHLTE